MPRPLHADDELLRPTLAAEDDPVHMRGAWNPWTLVILAVFGGPLSAGVLFAENARRLGRRAHVAWILGGALALVLAGGFAAARLRPLESFSDWSDTSVLRIAQRLGAALLAAPLATLQGRRFRVYTGNGGEPGKLLVYGLAAVFGAGFLGNLLAFGVMKWAS